AHRALGKSGTERPVVVDPFAGGGAFPLEALRIGADSIASELNPVAVLLNRAVQVHAPRHREALLQAFVDASRRALSLTAKHERELYPTIEGGRPLVYLWARTIRCEGPRCGRKIPLV